MLWKSVLRLWTSSAPSTATRTSWSSALARRVHFWACTAIKTYRRVRWWCDPRFGSNSVAGRPTPLGVSDYGGVTVSDLKPILFYISAKVLRTYLSSVHNIEVTTSTNGTIEPPPPIFVNGEDQPFTWRIFTDREKVVVLQFEEYISGLLVSTKYIMTLLGSISQSHVKVTGFFFTVRVFTCSESQNTFICQKLSV